MLKNHQPDKLQPNKYYRCMAALNLMPIGPHQITNTADFNQCLQAALVLPPGTKFKVQLKEEGKHGKYYFVRVKIDDVARSGYINHAMLYKGKIVSATPDKEL